LKLDAAGRAAGLPAATVANVDAGVLNGTDKPRSFFNLNGTNTLNREFVHKREGK
jgi:hypothetical protein